MPSEFDAIAQRLHDIAEELADLSIERLRNAIDAGGDQVPIDEKLIGRARRSIIKAATLLESGSTGNSQTDW